MVWLEFFCLKNWLQGFQSWKIKKWNDFYWNIPASKFGNWNYWFFVWTLREKGISHFFKSWILFRFDCICPSKNIMSQNSTISMCYIRRLCDINIFSFVKLEKLNLSSSCYHCSQVTILDKKKEGKKNYPENQSLANSIFGHLIIQTKSPLCHLEFYM